ncbi:restriction endonuclease [Geoglobus acetivorans]|uniref:Restriction endonuclease n=1 Tax=Geoglobus acetivorans TaxID=565033 RepID=A0ABZ3H1B0_GEOAI
MGFKLFFWGDDNSEKGSDEIQKLLKDDRAYKYISNLIKEAEKWVNKYRQFPTFDILDDYIDYDDIEKVSYILNNRYGYKLSGEDLEEYLVQELEKIGYEKFKEWIKLKNPRDENEIIRLFLQYDENIADEIDFAISDVDTQINAQYLKEIIGESLKYLTRVLQEYNIQLEERQIYAKIVEIIENMRLQRYESELESNSMNKISENDASKNALPICWVELTKMSGHDFETLIGSIFASLGFDVEKTKHTGDQGADLIISKGGLKIAVQVKRYSEKRKVGNKAVQEIVAAIKYYGTDKGMIITTSNYTKPAIELARANGIKLIGGQELKKVVDSLNSIYNILLS